MLIKTHTRSYHIKKHNQKAMFEISSKKKKKSKDKKNRIQNIIIRKNLEICINLKDGMEVKKKKNIICNH